MEFKAKKQGQANLEVIGFCEVCKQRIEQAALSVAGVYSAIWNIADNNLVLSFDPEQTSQEEISKAIAMDGYETQFHEADKDIYNALPGCCRHD